MLILHFPFLIFNRVLHLAVIQEESNLVRALAERLGPDGINMKNKQSQVHDSLWLFTGEELILYTSRFLLTRYVDLI